MFKVAVIGPESTGKSFLCAALAKHFNTTYVPEYARAYLMKHGSKYNEQDLWNIAQGQIQSEDQIANEVKDIVFIDTELNVVKVWSEFVFNSCNNKILQEIAKRKYDLYLLCNTDLPWVKDELREYPDLEIRNTLFQYYLDTVVNQDVPFEIISGSHQERVEIGIAAVKKYLIQ